MLTFIFFIWKTKTKGRNLPHLTHIKGSLYFVKPQLCQKGWLTPLQTQTVSLRSCYLSPCGLCWLCVLSGRSKSELHQVWGPRCHVGSPGDAGAAWAFVQSTWEWSYTWTVGLMAKQKWTYWVDKTFFLPLSLCLWWKTMIIIQGLVGYVCLFLTSPCFVFLFQVKYVIIFKIL